MVDLNQTDDYAASAQKDVELVQYLLPKLDEFPEAICFHCEQAAEKMLKQMWVENGVLPRHTHNVADLLAVATERGWVRATKEDIFAAQYLATYGTKIRYLVMKESEHGEAVQAVIECNSVADMLRRNGYEYFMVDTDSHFLRDEIDSPGHNASSDTGLRRPRAR